MKKKTTKKSTVTKTATKPAKIEKVSCNCKTRNSCNGFSAVYGLGFIGAAIYFISVATGFWSGVLGVLKAIIWPVFVVHGLLAFLGL